MKCINCKREIGEKDNYCPFCQYDMQAYRKGIEAKRKRRRIGIMLLVLTMLVVGMGFAMTLFYMQEGNVNIFFWQEAKQPTMPTSHLVSTETTEDDFKYLATVENSDENS